MTEFTVDDLRKFHEQEGEEANFVCPHCGPIFTLVDVEAELRLRGFVKHQSSQSDEMYLLAKFGICVGYHTGIENISPYGVPVIREDDYSPKLERAPLTPEELAIFDETIDAPARVLQPTNERRNFFKTSATAALGDYLYELDPPYVFEQFMSTWQEEDDNENLEKLNAPNEWFDCLWPLIKDTLDVKKEATIKENLLITIYLHKTTEMRHIEPLWLFWKRFGMGKRSLERAIASFPTGLPSHFQDLFTKIERDYEPDRSTIESLVNTLVLDKICPPMNGSEMQGFIQNATDFLGKMKRAPYGNLSCYEFLISEPLIADSMAIGGQTLPHAGIIELVCIYATMRQKTSSADEFLRTVFPSEAGPLWENVLSKHGKKIGIAKTINSLITHIEKNAQ
tara:strand:+ start:2833 stop:4017 length:1185 start_codon:yes stop_codon:yes gene_type:complete